MKAVFVLLAWLCSLVLGTLMITAYAALANPEILSVALIFLIVAFLTSLPALVITYVTALLLKPSRFYFWYVQLAHVCCTIVTYFMLNRDMDFIMKKYFAIPIFFTIGFAAQYGFHFHWLKKRNRISENDPLDAMENL